MYNSSGSVTVVDADGNVVADVPCRKCGYNLRGLRQEYNCPECGAPVIHAVQQPLLQYADPAWVKKLYQGSLWILWGILASTVAACLGGGLTAAANMGTLVAQGIVILAGLVALRGVLLLTEPDPSGIGENTYVTSRRLARFGVLVGLLGDVLNLSAGLPIVTAGVIALVLLLVGSVASLANIVGQVATFFYIEKLAKRMPNPSLAGHARFVWLGNIIIIGVVVLGAIGFGTYYLITQLTTPVTSTAPIAGTGPTVTGIPGFPAGTFPISAFPPAARLLLGGTVCICGLAFVIVSIAGLALYFRLLDALKKQVQTAEINWSVSTVTDTDAPGEE